MVKIHKGGVMGLNPIRYPGERVNHQGVRPPKGSKYFVTALCGAEGSDSLRPMGSVTCKKCLRLMQVCGSCKHLVVNDLCLLVTNEVGEPCRFRKDYPACEKWEPRWTNDGK